MVHRQVFAWMLVATLVWFAGGCGDSGYPEAKVKTPLDQAGQCQHCGKAIAKVAADNLLTIKAAQYVVCGEKCAVQIKRWHERQFGK